MPQWRLVLTCLSQKACGPHIVLLRRASSFERPCSFSTIWLLSCCATAPISWRIRIRVGSLAIRSGSATEMSATTSLLLVQDEAEDRSKWDMRFPSLENPFGTHLKALLSCPFWSCTGAACNESAKGICEDRLARIIPALNLAVQECCRECVARAHCVSHLHGESIKAVESVLAVDRAALAAKRDADRFNVVLRRPIGANFSSEKVSEGHES